MLTRLKAWIKRRVAGAELDELQRLRRQLRLDEQLRAAGFCADRPVQPVVERWYPSRSIVNGVPVVEMVDRAPQLDTTSHADLVSSLAELGCNPPPAAAAPGPVPRRRADDLIEDMGLPARAR
jgi:hypothetical protein